MSVNMQRMPVSPVRVWAFMVFGVLLFAAVFSLYAVRPPHPLPVDAPAEEFSACRAITHGPTIAAELHPSGSAGNFKVEQYIFETMKALGVETEIVTDLHVEGHGAAQRRMVLGRIPGTSNTKAFGLMSHYDSTPFGPGAADDGGGVMSLLETARALKASAPLKNDVIFAFTDCEEGAKLGATLFCDSPWFEKTGVLLNLEARGTQGNSLLFNTSPLNGWLVDQVIAGVRYPTTSSFMYDVYKRLPFGSDFDTLRERGMKGFDTAFIDNFPWYHTKNDIAAHLDLGTLQQHGMYTLDMARHFGSIPLDGSLTAPDAVYFNTVGYHMVRYPMAWNGPLIIVTLLLAGAVWAVGFSRKQLSISGFLLGVFAWPVAAAGSAVLAAGMVALVWGWPTAHVFYTQGITRIPDLYPLYHNTIYIVAMVSGTVAVLALVYGGLSRWVRAQNLAAASYVWWVAGLLILDRMLPGAGYLLMWPLAINALGLLLCFSLGKPGAFAAGWAVILTPFVLPALILSVPTFHVLSYTVLIMGGPGLVIYLALNLSLLAPQFDLMGRVNRWWLPLSGALLAAVLLGYGLINSSFTPLRPKLDSVSYGIDYDANAAYWLSPDAAPDEWTSQFFPADTPREECAEFGLKGTEKVMKAKAPIAEGYPGAKVEIKSDTTSGNVRDLTLHVSSPARAARLHLRLVSSGELLGASMFGKPLETERDHWRLDFRVIPEEGVDITLCVSANTPVRINTMETFYGLPEIPGFSPRPDYITATPNTVNHHRNMLESNQIYVVRTVEF